MRKIRGKKSTILLKTEKCEVFCIFKMKNTIVHKRLKLEKKKKLKEK